MEADNKPCPCGFLRGSSQIPVLQEYEDRFLQKIPQDDPTYTYSIKYLYYQIYKSEKKYDKHSLI